MIRNRVKYKNQNKKRENDPYYISYKEKVSQKGHAIPKPDLYNVQTIPDNKLSWCNSEIQYFNINDVNNYIPKFDMSNSVNQDIKLKTMKIRCRPNKDQQNILNLWFEADKLLYNETVCFLRKNIPYF
jgi:hypothetical protein